jgi:signal peptidase I
LPARGDVIVFRYPKDESINYIKRVVGLPGDVIQIRDKVLYINGKEVKIERFTDPSLEAGIENDDERRVLALYRENLDGVVHPVLYNMNSLLNSDYGPVEVPPGELLALGDNRDRSSDSRIWGFVPLENIKGKAMFVWLNFVFQLENEFRFQFRLERIGTVIR